MKILVLCTGNSCRSQMTEGFLKNLLPNDEIYSAGTNPSEKVNELAIRVMKEIGIDISKNKPKHVNNFLNIDFDYVITVCNEAEETCPVFQGKVKNRIHIGFEDPALIKGNEDYVLNEFRKVRDKIKLAFNNFVNNLNK